MVKIWEDWVVLITGLWLHAPGSSKRTHVNAIRIAGVPTGTLTKHFPKALPPYEPSRRNWVSVKAHSAMPQETQNSYRIVM
jgi:hypothetical protein